MIQYKKRKRRSKRPNKAEFDYMYYALDMTANEMAERYNVKPHTIYNWATEFRKEESKGVP